MTPEWQRQAICRDEPQLWDGETRQAALDAIEACNTCPVLAQCKTWAATQPELVGIVAGEPRDRATRERIERGPSREHGTRRGYYQHAYRRETPCRPCLDAMNAKEISA